MINELDKLIFLGQKPLSRDTISPSSDSHTPLLVQSKFSKQILSLEEAWHMEHFYPWTGQKTLDADKSGRGNIQYIIQKTAAYSTSRIDGQTITCGVRES